MLWRLCSRAPWIAIVPGDAGRAPPPFVAEGAGGVTDALRAARAGAAGRAVCAIRAMRLPFGIERVEEQVVEKRDRRRDDEAVDEPPDHSQQAPGGRDGVSGEELAQQDQGLA